MGKFGWGRTNEDACRWAPAPGAAAPQAPPARPQLAHTSRAGACQKENRWAWTAFNDPFTPAPDVCRRAGACPRPRGPNNRVAARATPGAAWRAAAARIGGSITDKARFASATRSAVDLTPQVWARGKWALPSAVCAQQEMATQPPKRTVRKAFRAAAKGDTAALEALVADSPELVAAMRGDGATLLHEACVAGQCEALRFLVDHGAALEARKDKYKTALHEAATHGHAACVDVLIAAGAAVDSHKTNGWTPLMYAAKGGHSACVDRLLADGADVHQVNREGATPLYLAARAGHPACVERLLGADAAVDAPTHNRRTPLFRSAHLRTARRRGKGPGRHRRARRHPHSLPPPTPARSTTGTLTLSSNSSLQGPPPPWPTPGASPCGTSARSRPTGRACAPSTPAASPPPSPPAT